MECIKVKALSFEGLENLVLYDTSRDGISKDVVFGERDHFEEFEKRWDGGRKGMRFVEAEGGRKKLKDGVEKCEFSKCPSLSDPTASSMVRECLRGRIYDKTGV